MSVLEESLYESGFSESQVKILLKTFALKGHSHEIGDITHLDQELDDLAEDLDELACK